jgi:Flp pilus assembly protein TadG
MTHCYALQQRLRDAHGVTLLWVAILLTVFIGIAALAIDVGYLAVARNESQNGADAAALAGARRLGENYRLKISPRSTDVTTAAQATAALNQVAAQNLAANNAGTQIGTWDLSAKTFDATAVDYPNAVQVDVKREAGLTNGPISTFFAPIVGVNTVNSRAIACAAISGTCNAGVGIPLGIGRSWFTHVGANRGCTQIAVNSTSSSCAGWTNLSTAKYNHKDVIDMLNDPATIPTVHVGDSVDFNGGTTQQVVNALDDLFRDKVKFRADKTFDAAGNVLTWTAAVIVYEDFDSCQNPNKQFEILGFATIKVTNVILTGNSKGPEGTVQCNIANDARGGCFYAGTYGNIPGLVK